MPNIDQFNLIYKGLLLKSLVKKNTFSLLKTDSYWMVFMNVYCVHLVPRHAQAIGGVPKNI